MLRQQYHALQAGDIVLGRISMRPSEEHLLLDLVERGIHLIPDALPQLASRSKTMQAQLFSPWLPPHTLAIHDVHQMMEALSLFPTQEHGIITKQDRKNAGMGIHFWSSMEEIYTQASLRNLPFPFVLQPFFPGAVDVRVIIIGDYLEAYQRHNPGNFRNNLHCGGQSRDRGKGPIARCGNGRSPGEVKGRD